MGRSDKDWANTRDCAGHPRAQFELQRFSALSPRIVAIGASTGGPQALAALLPQLAKSLSYVPVVIVLHMPSDFTAVVTSQVGAATGLPTTAAVNGEELRAGHIYFAPGGVHLKVVRVGPFFALAYSDGPPENFCKPAVDVLFRSAADAYGPGALGIVLTGMGSDGLEGARRIVDAGGSVIAQDEASSVVWGMPGAVARAGLAAAIVPIQRMSATVAMRLCGSARSAAQ